MATPPPLLPGERRNAGRNAATGCRSRSERRAAGRQAVQGGGPPWAEVLDAMDDPELEQVTIRGSVQSAKTATLIAAALGHMAAGRAVLVL